MLLVVCPTGCLQTVCSMDAAVERTWMCLQRVCKQPVGHATYSLLDKWAV